EVDEGPPADPPEAPHVAERGDADEQAGDDQRHDHHRDQPDERRAERLAGSEDALQRRGPGKPRDRPEREAADQPEEDLPMQRHPRPISSSASRSDASVRSTSAIRMSPMWPMRSAVSPYGPSASAVSMPFARIASRSASGSTAGGSAIAVSVLASDVRDGHCRPTPSAAHPSRTADAIALCRA